MTNIDIPLSFDGKPIGWHELDPNEVIILPYDISQPEGEHSLESRADCQQALAIITKDLKGIFEGKHNEEAKPFPYCCEGHSNLVKRKVFNRAHFEGVPEMTARKVIFTFLFIDNNIDTKDWYETITQYIDAVVQSFGEMPKDCGNPLLLGAYYNWIEHLLTNNDELQSGKKARILNYLTALKTPYEGPMTDIQALLNTYGKWLKLFPFEVSSYFGELKQHYEQNIPILASPPKQNRFSGVVQIAFHTQCSLIDSLIDLTKDLIDRVSTKELVNRGEISVINNHKLSIYGESKRLKTQKLTKKFHKGETEYLDVLIEWLRIEEEYFEKITPLLSPPISEQQKTKQETLREQLDDDGFFELDKVKRLSGDGKKRLVELISTNQTSKKDENTPYAIAMFDFLGFLDYLLKKYSNNIGNRNGCLSEILGVNKDTVKNNILSLETISKVDKNRYTAHLHKETVKKDYEELK